MPFSAKVICDSMSPMGNRLTTMELTYPRFIHSEFMTHRMFSRNAASSRAIPVQKMIDQVHVNPATPLFWGKNQPGMSAREELTDADREIVKNRWDQVRGYALEIAQQMANYGAHKQLVNRILEPFSWITVICTATEWANFFSLRTAPDVEPHFQLLAMLMYKAWRDSIPARVGFGEWHLPYIGTSGVDAHLGLDELRAVSVARCARVSYLTHEGGRNITKDLELYQKLLDSHHMSPFEHVARPLNTDSISETRSEWSGNFRGWLQYRKTVAGENVERFHLSDLELKGI